MDPRHRLDGAVATLRGRPRLLAAGGAVTALRTAVVGATFVVLAPRVGPGHELVSFDVAPRTPLVVVPRPAVALGLVVLVGVVLAELVRLFVRPLAAAAVDGDRRRVGRGLRGAAVALLGVAGTALLAVGFAGVYLVLETVVEAASYASGGDDLLPWWATIGGAFSASLAARAVVAAVLDPAELAAVRAGSTRVAVRESVRSFAVDPVRSLTRAGAYGALGMAPYAVAGVVALGVGAASPGLATLAGALAFGAAGPVPVALAVDRRTRGRVDVHAPGDYRVPRVVTAGRVVAAAVLVGALVLGAGLVRVGDVHPGDDGPTPPGPVSPSDPPLTAVADGLAATRNASHVAVAVHVRGGDDRDPVRTFAYTAYDRESREVVRVTGGVEGGSVTASYVLYRSRWLHAEPGVPAPRSRRTSGSRAETFRRLAADTADDYRGTLVLLFSPAENRTVAPRRFLGWGIGTGLAPRRAAPGDWRVANVTADRITYRTADLRGFRRVVTDGPAPQARRARGGSVRVTLDRSTGYVTRVERRFRFESTGERFVTRVSEVGTAEVPRPADGPLAVAVDVVLY